MPHIFLTRHVEDEQEGEHSNRVGKPNHPQRGHRFHNGVELGGGQGHLFVLHVGNVGVRDLVDCPRHGRDYGQHSSEKSVVVRIVG